MSATAPWDRGAGGTGLTALQEAFISPSFLKRLSLLNMESDLDKDLF